MNEPWSNQEIDRNLQALEERLTEALRLSRSLSAEKARLVGERNDLHADCEQLRQDNERKRSRIEAIIARLKDLETPA